MNVSKLCRSCMKEVASWEKENFDPRAVEMFCFCTNMKVNEEDKLPKQFCYDCTIRIESSFMFITEAQKVDVTLRSLLSRTNASVIVQYDLKTEYTYDKNFNNEQLMDPPDFNEDCTVPTVLTNSDDHNKNSEISTENPAIRSRMSVHNEADVLEKDISLKQARDVSVEDNNIDKRNVCPLCRKCFTTKTWLTKHTHREHRDTQYACSHCAKTFTKQQLLNQHMFSHSRPEDMLSCEVCSKRYKRRKQLTIHMKTHSDARPHICNVCHMCFKLKGVLRTHMKVHEGEKQYLCNQCGCSFAQGGNLSVHMRTHTGEKPYKCSECPFQCSVGSNLRRHQRRHRGAKPYLCLSCHKRFYDASSLARHKRTHTGELPYKCPYCSQFFIDSWKRKSHMMRQHKLALDDIPKMTRDGIQR